MSCSRLLRNLAVEWNWKEKEARRGFRKAGVSVTRDALQ